MKCQYEHYNAQSKDDEHSNSIKLLSMKNKLNQSHANNQQEAKMFSRIKTALLYQLKKLYDLEEIFKVLQFCSFFVCLLQNFLIIYILEDEHSFQMSPDFEIYDEKKAESQGIKYYQQKNIQVYLKLFQAFINLVMIITYILNYKHLISSIYQYEKNQQLLIMTSATISTKNKVYQKDNIRFVKHLLEKVNRFGLIINITYKYSNIFYFILYFLCALMGLLQPLFTAFLLIDIFRIFPILQSIYQSIFKSWKQLILTIILFLILTYYFSILFYYNFYQDHSPICNNLWLCFSFIFDQTYKNDAGFVSFVEIDYYDNWRFNMRVLFDFLYQFIILSLISEIISGIIIDTFKVIREEKEEQLKD